MNNLEKNSKLSTKVCKIQYAPASTIQSIVRISGAFYRKVLFYSGFGWLDLYHTPGSATFEQNQDQASAGTLFNQKLEMFFPGLEIESISDLFNMDNSPLILKLTLNSGEEYILGSLDIPVTFSESWSTTKAGSTFVFLRKSPEKAYKYEI